MHSLPKVNKMIISYDKRLVFYKLLSVTNQKDVFGEQPKTFFYCYFFDLDC